MQRGLPADRRAARDGLHDMLSCKEVTRMIASDELAEAGWWRRLTARLHLLMCVHCRRYERQVQILGRVARDVLRGGGEESAREGIDHARLDGLERTILEGAGLDGGDGDRPNASAP
jgi:hypothetical protein